MKITGNKSTLPGFLLGVVETGRLEHRVMRLLEERLPWARHGRLVAAAACVVVLAVASVGVGMFGVRASRAQGNEGTSRLPAFDAATIKPPDPQATRMPVGFYGSPGGKVFYGGQAKMLVEYAFNLQDYQFSGGPDWVSSRRFEINAVPPEDSPSRKLNLRTADPDSEQRLMLQSLLRDRFGLKYHFETKEGEVYILSRGSGPLQLKPPKDSASDPRAIVVMKQDGINDGEAAGINTTSDYLAIRLSRYLQLPVLNQTGITGSYDFELPAVDPENHDMTIAVFSVVERLGLKLKRGRGPVQTLMIDHIDLPTEN